MAGLISCHSKFAESHVICISASCRSGLSALQKCGLVGLVVVELFIKRQNDMDDKHTQQSRRLFDRNSELSFISED